MTDRPLTKKQERVLRIIADFAREHGFPPSVREMGAALGGIKSSSVARHIRALIKKGKLERGSSRARDLRFTSPLATYGMAGLGIRGYPILGSVPAGKPNIVGEEVEDTIWLDEKIARSKDSYILRVRGDSMIGRGIFEGDLAIIRPQKVAEIGEVVIARTPDGEGTIKTLAKKGQDFYLEAANSNYPPIPHPFEVAGKVVGVIHRF